MHLHVPCTIDPDILVSVFRQQEGRCYYTNTEMVWNNHGLGKRKKNPHALSVDRRNPTGGYTPDNVVLCTVAVNTAKGVLTEEEFYKLCASVLRLREGRILERILSEIRSGKTS